jgi:hypothetical protein
VGGSALQETEWERLGPKESDGSKGKSRRAWNEMRVVSPLWVDGMQARKGGQGKRTRLGRVAQRGPAKVARALANNIASARVRLAACRERAAGNSKRPGQKKRGTYRFRARCFWPSCRYSGVAKRV